MPKQQDIFLSAKQRLDAYIDANNGRKTQERYTILRQICQFPSQFTADQLLLLCSKELTMSRATIYNSLQLFLDAGLLITHSLYAGSKTMTYELVADKSSHIYMQCTNCGRVAEITDNAISNGVFSHRYSNFIASSYSLYVFGTCKHCRKIPTNNK